MWTILYLVIFAVGFVIGVVTESSYTYKEISVDEAAAILSANGIKATREQDTTSGNAYLKAQSGDLPFKVDFYECDGDKKCESMDLRVGFVNVSGGFGSIDRINNWNAKLRIGKAFLIDNKPTLIMTIIMKGGVTKNYLENEINVWKKVLPHFANYMAGGNL